MHARTALLTAQIALAALIPVGAYLFTWIAIVSAILAGGLLR